MNSYYKLLNSIRCHYRIYSGGWYICPLGTIDTYVLQTTGKRARIRELKRARESSGITARSEKLLLFSLLKRTDVIVSSVENGETVV